MAAIRYERDENGNLIAVPFTPTYNNGNHFAGTGDTKGRGAVRMSDQAYRALTQGGAQLPTDRDVFGEGRYGAREWMRDHPVGVIGAGLGIATGGAALTGGWLGAGAGGAGGAVPAAGGSATPSVAGFMPGSAAAPIEGITVYGSQGLGMGAGTEAAMAAAGAAAPASSSQGFDWKNLMNQSSPGGQQQQQMQSAPRGAKPGLWDRIKGGLGKMGDNLLQIDPEAAKTMSPDQLAALKRNAYLNMGLGMMAASNQGAGFGEAAAFGLGQGQAGLTNALQRDYQMSREVRQDQRQAQRDQISDERYTQEFAYQQEQDRTRQEMERQAQEATQARFNASLALDERGLGLRERELGMRSGLGQAPSGYRWGPDGNLQAIQGGPADPSNKTGNFQEAERTAAFLATRLGNSLKTLRSISDEDQTPGLMETAAQALGSEVGANVLRSSDRQKANAAQLDALDAAITLATGAAYTKEQLESARVAHFPQIGDSEQTKALKKQKLEQLLQAARIKAGRASTAIDEALSSGATGTWTIEEVQ